MTPPPVPAWFTAAWWDHIADRIEDYARDTAEYDVDEDGCGEWVPNPPDADLVGEWISMPDVDEQARGFIYPPEYGDEDHDEQEAADWVLLNAWIAWALEPDSKHTAEQSREIAQDVADRRDERGYGPL